MINCDSSSVNNIVIESESKVVANESRHNNDICSFARDEVDPFYFVKENIDVEAEVEDICGPPFRIKLLLSGVESVCVFDTGSSFSVMSRANFLCFCNDPRYSGPKVVTPYSGSVPTSASHHSLKVLGQVPLDITIAKTVKRVRFLVVENLSESVLLGRNAIDAFGNWSYSPKSKRLIVKGEAHYLCETYETDEIFPCYFVGSLTVEPMSAVVVPVDIMNKDASATRILFIEPSVNFRAVSHLASPSVVVHVEGQACVLVCNHTDNPVKIKSGQHFGFAETLDVNRSKRGCLSDSWAVNSLLGRPKLTNEVPDTPLTPEVSSEERKMFLDENLDLSGCDLSAANRNCLKDLIYEYADIFSVSKYDLGCTNIIEHTIDTGDAKPVSTRPYHVGPFKRAIIEKEVSKLLSADLIFPSAGPWSSGVCLVKKKNGDWRMCVDYRRLNDVTVKDQYPLPRTLDLLQSLSGHQYFTSLDLASGFNQVPVANESKLKTQFTCFLGTFSYHRMSFGVTVNPSQFSRLISECMRGLLYKEVVAFIDDLLVLGCTEDEHLRFLRDVFDRLRQANLKLGLSKCSFALPKVHFLGHIVDKHGIHVDDSKVTKVKEYPAPYNITTLRRFLGVVAYYSMFIRNYSDVVSPLHRLLRKDVEFCWDLSCANAFDRLKLALTTAPVLMHPDFSREFRLYCDASEVALGSVLCQIDESSGYEKPVSYYSRSFRSAEFHYSNTDRELLAVCESLKHFKQYLYGGRCIVFTDNMAVKHLLNSETLSQRDGKFLFTMMGETDWSIRYVPGAKNVVADCLSRVPDFSDDASLDVTETAAEYMGDLGSGRNNINVVTRAQSRSTESAGACVDIDLGNSGRVSTHSVVDDEAEDDEDVDVPDLDDLDDSGVAIDDSLLDKVVNGQQTSNETRDYIDYITLGVLPADGKRSNRVTQHYMDYKLDEQGVLRHRDPHNFDEWRIVVPVEVQVLILAAFHDDPLGGGHQGLDVVYDRMRRRFYWPGMFTRVRDYIKSCKACLFNKDTPHPQRTLLQPIVSHYKFERVATDITGPLKESESGNKYIIAFVDHFSKFAITEAVSDISAENIARIFVERVCCLFGPPAVLLSDQGANFLSNVVLETCKLFRTRRSRTNTYCPATNGACERFWRSLKGMLRNYVNDDQDNWDEILPLVTYAYNSSFRSSTGMSLFEVLFGESAKHPIDNFVLPTNTDMQSKPEIVRRLVRHIKAVQQKVKKTATKRRIIMKKAFDSKAREITFKVNDLVLLKIQRLSQGGKCKSLSPFWEGPHRVVYAPRGSKTVILRMFDDTDGSYVCEPVQKLKYYVQRSVAPISLLTNDLLQSRRNGEDLDSRLGRVFVPAGANNQPSTSGSMPMSSPAVPSTSASAPSVSAPSSVSASVSRTVVPSVSRLSTSTTTGPVKRSNMYAPANISSSDSGGGRSQGLLTNPVVALERLRLDSRMSHRMNTSSPPPPVGISPSWRIPKLPQSSPRNVSRSRPQYNFRPQPQSQPRPDSRPYFREEGCNPAQIRQGGGEGRRGDHRMGRATNHRSNDRRYNGKCHFCGIYGHKMAECRRKNGQSQGLNQNGKVRKGQGQPPPDCRFGGRKFDGNPPPPPPSGGPNGATGFGNVFIHVHSR